MSLKQIDKVLDVLVEGRNKGEWRRLDEIARRAGAGEASASARIRDLRNIYGWKIERRRVAGLNGPFEYRAV